jgi:hypothetical protein
LPDPAAAGHAIIFPRYPLTISRVMESIKVGSTHRINSGRRESGLLRQPRFFHRAVRAVQEYYEKVEYIHLTRCGRGWGWQRTEHAQTKTIPCADLKICATVGPNGVRPRGERRRRSHD